MEAQALVYYEYTGNKKRKEKKKGKLSPRLACIWHHVAIEIKTVGWKNTVEQKYIIAIKIITNFKYTLKNKLWTLYI